MGKPSKNFYERAQEEFISRINRYISLKITRLEPPRVTRSMDDGEIRRRESEIFRNKMNPDKFNIILDENGRSFNSIKFAEFVNHKMSYETRPLVFHIGGAMGFSREIKDLANQSVRLSEMTMPHHLARVVFLEQLYRAFTIINGESYHNK